MQITNEKLKELLVESGLIKDADFDIAEKEAIGRKFELQELLVEKGLIKDEQIGRMIADELGYQFVDLKKANISEISEEMMDYIPEVVAFSQRAIVFNEDEKEIKIATSDPGNYTFFKILEQKIGKKVTPFYATPFDIGQALKRYKGDLMVEMRRMIKELEKGTKEEVVVDLVNLIMEYGHSNIASDIHIEPITEFAVIRFRIDGILHKVAEYPKSLHDRIVSRIKIMARLRTDERAASQDGRFAYESLGGGGVDVRVSIMPTTDGENVVMRLLMQRGKRLSIDDLGLLEHDLKKLKSASQKPYGMIILVGPTGSGKTTTLYSVLQMLNEPEVNIMTIEDPIEYNIEGVQQTQVNPAKDITFPKGLRTIVRQDPDIIMVGEIRDQETVDMALNSAMTGHLVLSTMHANDSATTFPRFLEMGAEPFLVASSINVSIAQRLARKICEECRENYFLSKEEAEIIEEEEGLKKIIQEISGINDLTKIKFYRGKGCRFCKDKGYEGRVAIFEVLEVTEGIRNLIVQKESSDIIKKKAIEEGMSTMVHDGVSKALMGIISIEEVRKIVKI
jgi:type II secretory ATPase GspE/PulE/Tfp pilus assembly ATPase PilB-like protein